MHYEVIIYWDAQDGIYVAEVPELLGCAAHGDTYEAALHEAQGAMETWVKVARELGRSVPEPKGRLVAAG